MKLELKIIDLLNKNKEKNLTMNEIAKSLNQHYSLVYRVIERLSNDKVLVKKKIGNSHVCHLNLDNEKTEAFLTLAEIEKKEEFYFKNKEIKLILEDFISLIKKDNLYSVILFGSYAKGNPLKNSDIDILILVKNKTPIGNVLRELYAKYGKEINVVMITLKELKEQKDKELFKEIIHNHYILYGFEIFSKEMLNENKNSFD